MCSNSQDCTADGDSVLVNSSKDWLDLAEVRCGVVDWFDEVGVRGGAEGWFDEAGVRGGTVGWFDGSVETHMMDPGGLGFFVPEDTVTNTSGNYSCYI